MRGEKDNLRNKDPPTPAARDLEALLGVPNLDTDVVEFLALVGYWPSLREVATEVQQRIREYYEARRRELTRSEKILETKFSLCVRHGYGRDFRTLGDLKRMIEGRGLIYPQMGYKGLARFNEALNRYGIPPFKVGGYIHKNLLRRYGLEASTRSSPTQHLN